MKECDEIRAHLKKYDVSGVLWCLISPILRRVEELLKEPHINIRIGDLPEVKRLLSEAQSFGDEMARVADMRGKGADRLLEDRTKLHKLLDEERDTVRKLRSDLESEQLAKLLMTTKRDSLAEKNEELQERNDKQCNSLNEIATMLNVPVSDGKCYVGEIKSAVQKLKDENKRMSHSMPIIVHDDLANKLHCTKQDLAATRKKVAGLEQQVASFKADVAHGEKWEAELRGVLGIAGPHTKGVKIIDAVRLLKAGGPKNERERIFRMLTTWAYLSKGFNTVTVTNYSPSECRFTLEYTKQGMSDFLNESTK